MTDEWRFPKERAALVEQLIASEKRCRLLERTLTEYAEHVDEDRTVGSHVLALQARIAALELNIARLSHRRKSA